MCSENQWTGFYMIGTFVMKELSTSVDTMYHGLKSDMTKRLSATTIKRITRVAGKSNSIIEMPTLIQENCCAIADIICF